MTYGDLSDVFIQMDPETVEFGIETCSACDTLGLSQQALHRGLLGQNDKDILKHSNISRKGIDARKFTKREMMMKDLNKLRIHDDLSQQRSG